MRWLQARLPPLAPAGPYHHGDRDYFQWMVRGPALTGGSAADPRAAHPADLDAHAHARLMAMLDPLRGRRRAGPAACRGHRSIRVSLPRRAAARLDELAGRYEFSAGAVEALSALLEFQAVDPTASTAIRDPAEAVDGHVADSLVALDLPSGVRTARRIADLGSGAGWPGLGLAAALPAASVHVLDDAMRHCRYLERASRARGGLPGTTMTVVHARAEEWARPDWEVHAFVHRARAPRVAAGGCSVAAPLLATSNGGMVVAWKDRAPSLEEARLTEADFGCGTGSFGLEPVGGSTRSSPFPAARERTLAVLRKVSPTPPRFPRRARNGPRNGRCLHEPTRDCCGNLPRSRAVRGRIPPPHR